MVQRKRKATGDKAATVAKKKAAKSQPASSSSMVVLEAYPQDDTSEVGEVESESGSGCKASSDITNLSEFLSDVDTEALLRSSDSDGVMDDEEADAGAQRVVPDAGPDANRRGPNCRRDEAIRTLVLPKVIELTTDPTWRPKSLRDRVGESLNRIDKEGNRFWGNVEGSLYTRRRTVVNAVVCFYSDDISDSD